MLAPARVVIPPSGVTTGFDGVTVAEPPPVVSGFFAASPMTAIDPALPAGQGQRAALVLEQHRPWVAIRVDSSWCAGVLTFVPSTVAGSGVGWSNRPIRNIAVSTCRTMRFSCAAVTSPDWTAALSLELKYWTRRAGRSG